MTEKETRELIERLRKAKGSPNLKSVLLGMHNAERTCLQAAAALEDTLWKPIADMPEELMDGRELIVSIRHYKSKTTRRVTMQYLYGNFHLCFDGSKLNYDWDITHYREITTPEPLLDTLKAEHAKNTDLRAKLATTRNDALGETAVVSSGGMTTRDDFAVQALRAVVNRVHGRDFVTISRDSYDKAREALALYEGENND